MDYKSECCDALIIILKEVRELLAVPENDFSWSGWEGTDAALAELDDILSTLRLGELPSDLIFRVLFLPTGPLQEVSVNSNWGSQFLALATRFDLALAKCM